MKLLHLVFAFLCLMMLVIPGFSGIGNISQCFKARGICYQHRCPDRLKQIGNCSRKVVCCR
uniref:Beta-defensin-like domain-containing protein n=1 Tax=Salvator merianae TaxID=96440 RepID=A0A8D0BBF6_SALMN